MKKEKVLIGVVVALIALAIIYAALYFTVIAPSQSAISPSDSSIQLSPQSYSGISFLIIFGMCALIIGGIGFITGEKERMQKNLESDKKLKKLDDLSLVRLQHHSQREIYEGKDYNEVLNKLETEGWHKHTVKKVKNDLHIPKHKK